MSTLTRKQREIRERDLLIREAARKILLEQGFHNLTMDRIATAVEYSKGTIYQHYKSKEDVLTALAADALGKEVALFERAATFKGRARERVSAIGVASDLYMVLYPEEAMIDRLLCGVTTLEKAQPERRAQLDLQQQACVSVITGIVRDGVASGDLVMPARSTPETLAFGLWTLTLGAASINPDVPKQKLGIEDPSATTQDNAHRLLDGHRWYPLRDEWDWDSTYQRIESEVFAAEFAELRSR